MNIVAPIKFVTIGDRVAAGAFIGPAKREMARLESLMGFQGLQEGVTRPRVVSPEGVTISCSKRFGERIATITVPAVSGGGEHAGKMCLCNCNLSLGWIVEVQEDTIDDAPLYTVMACNYKRRFIRYRDVLASDWAVYVPGQKVLLTPYYQMAYLCCVDDTMHYGNESGYGCRAMVSPLEKEDADWLTSYRIIPYMARLIPKVIEVRNGAL